MKIPLLGFVILCASIFLPIIPVQARDKADTTATWTAAPLEQRSYIMDMEVIAHHFSGQGRGPKMQMMAIGDRRYLIQSWEKHRGSPQHEEWGQIVDITDPLKPEVIADQVWPGNLQIQVAFHEASGKWLAMVPIAPPESDIPIEPVLDIYDISNPGKPQRLSRLIVSSHRNYYDGGRYAYLSGGLGPGFFTGDGRLYDGWTLGLVVADLFDPSAPRIISKTHFPGQRSDEVEARKNWKAGDNMRAAAVMHGPAYVPVRVEDGGKYAYSPWGALGVQIHDVSNPEDPELVSQWLPEDGDLSGTAFHTVDVARLDRGYVIANPEPLMPQCQWPWQDTYILDVSDPAEPKQLSKLPVPKPPEEAPYETFCDRYGRFGPHNPPHLKAPGKPAPNFTCYAYFNAGLQCFDISDPRNPVIVSYFVPKQGDANQAWEPTPDFRGKSIRTADNVFIEWDRRLIWLAADSGLYVLSTPMLGRPILDPMPVKEWALPSINRGWDQIQ